jgi:hypothetical protein
MIEIHIWNEHGHKCYWGLARRIIEVSYSSSLPQQLSLKYVTHTGMEISLERKCESFLIEDKGR